MKVTGIKLLLLVMLIVSLFFAVAGCAQDTGDGAGVEPGEEGAVWVMGYMPNTLQPPWGEGIASLQLRAAELSESGENELEVLVLAPEKHGSLEEQSAIFDDFISRGVDVIVGIGADSQSYAGLAKRASDAGIPVGVIVETTEIPNVTFRIANDEVAGGIMLGERIVSDLDGKGNILLLHGQKEHSVDIGRAEGLMTVFNQYPEINILAAQEAGWAQLPASEVMDDWIVAFGDEIDAVVALNDNMALGAIAAAKSAGKSYYVTGWDATKDAMTSILAGEMVYTMDMNFTLQGKITADAVWQLLTTGSVDPYYEIPYTVVDNTNAQSILDRIENTLKGIKGW